MINLSLQLFCNRAVATGQITAEDARGLATAILSDGFASRDEADMLIALDRAVPQADAMFGDVVAAAVVDLVVWGERPTGYVDPATARWLVASLRNGAGPTRLAARIAFEVVREAQASDETLIAFAMAANSRGEGVQTARLPDAIAA